MLADKYIAFAIDCIHRVAHIGEKIKGEKAGGSSLPQCTKDPEATWDMCFGIYTYKRGDKYVDEWKGDKRLGQGTYYYLEDDRNKGDKYVGKWKQNEKHGQGAYSKLMARNLSLNGRKIDRTAKVFTLILMAGPSIVSMKMARKLAANPPIRIILQLARSIDN